MGLFRKPKLSKEEKELLRKAEHEAYFATLLQKSKRKGKHKAEKGTGLKGLAKTLGGFMNEASKNAAAYNKQLEKEFGVSERKQK